MIEFIARTNALRLSESESVPICLVIAKIEEEKNIRLYLLTLSRNRTSPPNLNEQLTKKRKRNATPSRKEREAKLVRRSRIHDVKVQRPYKTVSIFCNHDICT